MTNDRWKPVYLTLLGDKQKSLSYRKFAEKILSLSKERNEDLGNYKNPVYVHREHGIVEIKTVSLPGYDIIQIRTPLQQPEEEPKRAEHLYSGLNETRYNAGGNGYYLRYYPADYEVYNKSAGLDPVDGASVDGESEDLLSPLPPNRWLFNDYSLNPTEAPWFDESYIWGPVAGRFSGKLRWLVQLQLGLGIYVGFSYNINESHGLRVEEDMETGVMRLWLYSISASGVRMQLMFDYTQEALEDAAGWIKGSTPPEIVDNGWFCLQSSFDYTRPVMTKAAYDALPDNEKPGLTGVTFELLDSATYTAAVSDYGALGDYGWSFNSDCSSAVFVGINYNYPIDGSPAVNYKSQLFTISISGYSATISGGGKKIFVHNAQDQLKIPDALGGLNSYSLYRTQTGYVASQPSTSYIAPQYAYYDLTDSLQLVNYMFQQGTVQDINGDLADSNWSAVYADCRQSTGYAQPNYEYTGCGHKEVGHGLYNEYRGFVTSALSPTSYGNWTGWQGDFGSLEVHEDYWSPSQYIDVFIAGGWYVPAGLHWTHQWFSQVVGTFNSTTYNCIVVPSFERVAIHHYKRFYEIPESAYRKTPIQLCYEHGSPVMRWGCACISGCDYTPDCPAGGSQINPAPEYEIGGYWVSYERGTPFYTYSGWHTCTFLGEPAYCALPDDRVFDVAYDPGPPAESPYVTPRVIDDGAIILPDGTIIVLSDEELARADPYKESGGLYAQQSVVSAYDNFSGRYLFSLPEIYVTDCVNNVAGEYPTNGFLKPHVAFVGNPGLHDDTI